MCLGATLHALAAETSRAQQSQAEQLEVLAERLHELREVEAGSLTMLRSTAGRYQRAVAQAPEAPHDTRASFDDLATGLRARSQPLTTAADFAWSLALTLRDAGRTDSALALLEHALPRLSELPGDDTFVCWIHIEMCELLRHNGDWSASLEHLEAARIGLFAKDDPFVAVAPTESSRAIAVGTWFDVGGQFYFELGRSEIAAKYFDEHERRSLEIGESSLWWGALDNHLRLAYSTKRFDDLERLWYEAQDHPFWSRGHPEERGHIDFTVARAFLDGERLGEREVGDTFEMLIEIAAAPGVHPFEAFAAELLLATILLDEDEPEEAQAFLEAARERRDSWGVSATEGGRAFFALKAAEWRAARASRDRSRIEAAQREADDVFEHFLESWGSAPLAPDGTGFLQTPWRAEFLSERIELQLVLGEGQSGARAAFENLLEVQALGTLTRLTSADEVSLATIEKLFPETEKHCALVFSLGRERSLAFILGGSSILTFELASDARIGQTQERLRETAFDVNAGLVSSTKSLETALRQASAALLPQELEQELSQWDAITVVGAEGAGIFAFEALGTQGAPIGVRKAIDHVPSLPIAAWLEARSDPMAGRRSGIHIVFPNSTDMAPARFAHLRSIPFDEAHVSELRRVYGEATVWSRGDARLDSLVGAETSSALALTFIAHGLYAAERPQPTGLLLEGGDLLWAGDVARLRAPPVVSLIACGAGRGLVRVGDDGRSHLGAAFLKAGARSVLLGSMDLALPSGLYLNRVFHERLGQGDTPAEALRRARQKAIVEFAGGVHPIQQLSVRLYGAGHEALTPRIQPAPAQRPGEDSGSLPWRSILGLSVGLSLVALLVVRSTRRSRAHRHA